jgi:CysZ protein
MLRAFSLSLQSLSDPRILGVLLKSVLLTAAIFTVFGLGLWYGIDALLARFGMGDDTVSALAAAAILILGGFVLFRVIAIAVLWVFSDTVVDVVEDRYYPDHGARANSPGLAASVGMALRSAGRALGYNLLASPVYLLLLVTGIGTAMAFLGVNALLLGRDLEDMLIARHGRDYAAMGRMRRTLIGLIGTAAMLVPFINFVVPVVITAMAVHMAHSQKRDAR